MTRLLLAFLALLTGLAVESAPASARICTAAGAEIGVMQVESGEGAVAAQALPGGVPLARQLSGPRGRTCPITKSRSIYIPTVQLGIDQSRE